MAKKMLIDATHPEETRVVVADGNKVDNFDFESITKTQITGNIYLAKVTRVEPSLQAAFVDYGGNRHGFLAFAEVHPDYYQIPVADREALLAEEEAEEAALRRAQERSEEPRGGEPEAKSGRSKRGDEGSRRKRRGGKKDRDVTGLEVIEPEGDGPQIDPEEDGFDAEASGNGDAGAGADDDGDPHRTMSEATGLGSDSVTGELQADDSERDPADADHAEAADPAAPAETGAETGAEADGAGDGDGGKPQGRGRQRRRRRGKDKDSERGEERADEKAAEAKPAANRRGDDNGDDEDDARVEEAKIDDVGAEDLTAEVAELRRTRRRRYKIQDVIKVRQIMLVQVVKEERGNKGAALTTYLSLAGRYCVLMPNTARGGGISRKITQATDRKRLRDIVGELEVPKGMGLIVRTAGAERTRAEIKRDYEFLIRQWEQIRELTLKSIAPTLIYEEGSLIKRAIRDLYSKEIDAILVEGDEGYREAKDYMKMLMPSHAKNVQQYQDQIPLFIRYQVESYLNAMFNPTVQLKSGGYIVIGVTEALVAIDVNSGRSTREGSIEETALKTNLEAADEVARQLRLRDLAGLIVIDFIDMDEPRNNRAVEKRMKERLKNDRARIQVGRISAFGLMEMSRQRLRPGMLEATTQPCPHCHGTGSVRSDESLALAILRELEEEGVRGRAAEITLTVPVGIANYLMNQKRAHLNRIEERYGVVVMLHGDPSLTTPNYSIERSRHASRPALSADDAVITAERAAASVEAEEVEEVGEVGEVEAEVEAAAPETKSLDRAESDADSRSRRRRGKRGGRRRRGREDGRPESEGTEAAEAGAERQEAADDRSADRSADDDEEKRPRRRRRRGRRGDEAEATDAGTEAAQVAADAADAAPTPTEPEVADTGSEVADTGSEVVETRPEVADTGSEPFEFAEAPAAAAPAAETGQPVAEREAEPAFAETFGSAPAAEPEQPAEPETAPVAEERAEEQAEEPKVDAMPEAVQPAPAAAAPEPAEAKAGDGRDHAPETKSMTVVEGALDAPDRQDEAAAQPADDEQPRKKRRGWWSLR